MARKVSRTGRSQTVMSTSAACKALMLIGAFYMVLLIISVVVPDKAAPVGSNRPVSSSRREPSPLHDTRPYTVISLVELDEGPRPRQKVSARKKDAETKGATAGLANNVRHTFLSGQSAYPFLGYASKVLGMYTCCGISLKNMTGSTITLDYCWKCGFMRVVIFICIASALCRLVTATTKIQVSKVPKEVVMGIFTASRTGSKALLKLSPSMVLGFFVALAFMFYRKGSHDDTKANYTWPVIMLCMAALVCCLRAALSRVKIPQVTWVVATRVLLIPKVVWRALLATCLTSTDGARDCSSRTGAANRASSPDAQGDCAHKWSKLFDSATEKAAASPRGSVSSDSASTSSITTSGDSDDVDADFGKAHKPTRRSGSKQRKKAAQRQSIDGTQSFADVHATPGPSTAGHDTSNSWNMSVFKPIRLVSSWWMAVLSATTTSARTLLSSWSVPVFHATKSTFASLTNSWSTASVRCSQVFHASKRAFVSLASSWSTASVRTLISIPHGCSCSWCTPLLITMMGVVNTFCSTVIRVTVRSAQSSTTSWSASLSAVKAVIKNICKFISSSSVIVSKRLGRSFCSTISQCLSRCEALVMSAKRMISRCLLVLKEYMPALMHRVNITATAWQPSTFTSENAMHASQNAKNASQNAMETNHNTRPSLNGATQTASENHRTGADSWYSALILDFVNYSRGNSKLKADLIMTGLEIGVRLWHVNVGEEFLAEADQGAQLLHKAIFHHGFSNDGKFDTSQEQLQFLSQSHRGVELFARKAAALQYLKQAAKVHAVMVRQLPAEFKDANPVEVVKLVILPDDNCLMTVPGQVLKRRLLFEALSVHQGGSTDMAQAESSTSRLLQLRRCQ